MSTIFEPKSYIYGLLTSIVDCKVYQIRPEVIVEYPSVTFYVTNNIHNALLNKDLGVQEIEVTIDLWGKTSKDTGLLLTSIEEGLRAEGLRLTFSQDVPDPDGISHVVTRFNFSY